MKFNYDKVKHTAGVIALALIPVAAGMPYTWAKWAALGCGAVAFLLGVQSEQMFVKQIVTTVEEKKP